MSRGEIDVTTINTLKLAAAVAALGAALGMRPAGAFAQTKGDAKSAVKGKGPASGKPADAQGQAGKLSTDKKAEGTVTSGSEEQQMTVKQHYGTTREGGVPADHQKQLGKPKYQD
jgi:hypothetical protein